MRNCFVSGSTPESWRWRLPVRLQHGYRAELVHNFEMEARHVRLVAIEVLLRQGSPNWQKSKVMNSHIGSSLTMGRVSHILEDAGFSILQSTPQSIQSCTSSATRYSILLCSLTVALALPFKSGHPIKYRSDRSCGGPKPGRRALLQVQHGKAIHKSVILRPRTRLLILRNSASSKKS